MPTKYDINPFTGKFDKVIDPTEAIAHADLSDMPDSGGTNTDHDTRYWTQATDQTLLTGDKSGSFDLTTTGDVTASDLITTEIKTKTILGTDANGKIIEGTHQDISGKQDTLVSGTNIKTVNSTSLLGSGNVAVQALPTFPVSPIPPYWYVLNGELWFYTVGTSTWSKSSKSIGKPIGLSILTNQFADWRNPSTYPAGMVTLDNQGLPTELMKRVRRRQDIVHIHRIKAKITGTSSTFTGQVGDYIKLTVNNDDGEGDQVFDDISLATCTGIHSPPGDNTRVEAQIMIACAAAGDPILIASAGANPLILTNWHRIDGYGARGTGCTIKIEKGTSNTNSDVLTRLGFTDGQNGSGSNGTNYPDRKGARFMPYQQLSKVSAEAGTFTFDFVSHPEWKEARLFRFCNWARDVNHNIVRFNESLESLVTIRAANVEQWGIIVLTQPTQ